MNKQTTLPGLSDELEEGEDVFVMRARDPLTPHMAALWAALRLGDTASAVTIFADIVADPAYQYRTLPTTDAAADKINSASFLAQQMNEWRRNKGLPVYGLSTVKA